MLTWGSYLAMNAGVRYGLDPKLLAGTFVPFFPLHPHVVLHILSFAEQSPFNPEVMNVSSGMSFHTLKRNPVKGVNASSPPNATSCRVSLRNWLRMYSTRQWI